MNENEKNSINSDAPEKNLAEEYNSVFDYNTETFIEHDHMNRDYLRLIYNDDMECLNKETRFTRSQYLKRMADIEVTFDKEIKANKKRFLIFTAILIAAIIISVVFYFVAQPYKAAYLQLMQQRVHPKYRIAYWAASGFFSTVSWASLVVGILQFLFFGYGVIKTNKTLKRNRAMALTKLEEIKKESMLLGVYNPEK
ncbi:MAG: hypothetical protein ACI4KI_00745 [Candidatus Fimenecus sp.]